MYHFCTFSSVCVLLFKGKNLQNISTFVNFLKFDLLKNEKLSCVVCVFCYYLVFFFVRMIPFYLFPFTTPGFLGTFSVHLLFGFVHTWRHDWSSSVTLWGFFVVSFLFITSMTALWRTKLALLNELALAAVEEAELCKWI